MFLCHISPELFYRWICSLRYRRLHAAVGKNNDSSCTRCSTWYMACWSIPCLWADLRLLGCLWTQESVRYLPDWFPGTSFKRYAKNMRAELDDWVTRPWELVKSHKVRVWRHLENVHLTMDRYRCRHLLVVLWINILIWQKTRKTSSSGLQHLYTQRDLILFVYLDCKYVGTRSWNDSCRPSLVSQPFSWRWRFSQMFRNVHKRKLIMYWVLGSMHDFLCFKINKICPLFRHWSQRYCDGVGYCLWELRVVLSSKIFMRDIWSPRIRRFCRTSGIGVLISSHLIF